MNQQSRKLVNRFTLLVPAIAFGLSFIGCAEERKEKVIDIKAPGVSIEVERGENSADVKIETDRRKRD